MPSSRYSYVYILASQKNGTLYIGITTNLLKRMHEYKNNLVESFTKKYNVHKIEKTIPLGVIYTMNCFNPSWYCLDSRLRGNDGERGRE